MQRKLAVFGAGGHASVVADTALSLGFSDVFFFDEKKKSAATKSSHPIEGNFSELLQGKDNFDAVIVGIGLNSVRLAKTKKLISIGARVISLVHPRAHLAMNVSLGAGSVVFAGAVIQTGTILGVATIINTSASVDHGCKINDGAHICPGAHLAGDVVIGSKSMVGVGASIVNGVRVGTNSIIGGGAAVVKDIPSSQTAVGVPAVPVCLEKK